MAIGIFSGNSGNGALKFALIIDMVAPLSASKSNMTFLFGWFSCMKWRISKASIILARFIHIEDSAFSNGHYFSRSFYVKLSIDLDMVTIQCEDPVCIFAAVFMTTDTFKMFRYSNEN